VRHYLSQPKKPEILSSMAERAQLSRPPLERMLKIHDILRRGTLVNCTRLCAELEVCRKTIVRDIGFMRDRLDLPIEFDPQIQSYRYTQPVTAFPTVQVSEGELVALLVARRALEQYRGTPFHRQLEVAFDKLAAGLKDRISFSPADELGSVSFKNIGLGKTDLTVFNALSLAVLKQLEVSFEYKKPGGKKKDKRLIQPYHLTHRENLWYLIGYDLERHALRTFALPRIDSVQVSTKEFSRPKDFSPEKFFSGAMGVLQGSGSHDVVLRFTAQAADRVKEREWHESQSMKELPDGRLELHLKLGALEEVETWVLRWGTAVEVLGPSALRERMRKTAHALQKMYQ